MPEETSLHSLLGAQDQQLGVEQDHLPCGSSGSSWQLSGDGNVHGSGMPHATAASPKPYFRASWRMGDAVVGR